MIEIKILTFLACLWVRPRTHGTPIVGWGHPLCFAGACEQTLCCVPAQPAVSLRPGAPVEARWPSPAWILALRGGAGSSVNSDGEDDDGAASGVTGLLLGAGEVDAQASRGAPPKHREKLSRADKAPRRRTRRGDHATSPSALFQSGQRSLPQVRPACSLPSCDCNLVFAKQTLSPLINHRPRSTMHPSHPLHTTTYAGQSEERVDGRSAAARAGQPGRHAATPTSALG